MNEMRTTCPECGERMVSRAWVSKNDDPPLFADTYKCGAVKLWGAIEVGHEWARFCPDGPLDDS